MSSLTPADRDRLRSEAAEWLNLSLSGDMDDTDEKAFEAWIQTSPDHGHIYATVQTHWGMIGALADNPLVLAAHRRDIKVIDRAPARKRRFPDLAIAAMAGIAGLMILLPGVIDFGGRSGPPGAPPIENPLPQRIAKTLADGSVVTLDADSEMRVAEMGARRRVELVRGRAFFRVAKDASRPFSVAAGGKIVHAVGTAFDVRIVGEEVIVTLVEGKVRIEDPPKLFNSGVNVDLVAGMQLIARNQKPWIVDKVDIGKATSWHKGQLIFLGDTLSSAMNEVNRYSTAKINFKDGPIPSKQIVGVFQAGDTNAFVKALDMNHIARVNATYEDKIELVPY